MSASEKLKALGAGLPRERITEHIMAEGWNPDWATPQKLEEVSRQLRLEAYDAALPQIVAVVEAGKFALPVLQAYSINADEEGFQTAASQMHEAHEVLAAALAALEEALS